MPAMTAPRVWKRGFVSLGAVVLVVMGAGVARADVAFRKKPPAATDSSSLEGAPSGSDTGDTPATETAPAEGAAEKGPYSAQAEDKDSPEAQALRDKQRADAALARQARNEQLARDKDKGTPIYQKWQFWAISGGVLVGGLLAFFAGKALFHDANGGDVRACPMGATGGCFGEGR